MATNGKPKLTPRKRRAIAALLSEKDVKAAAQTARVGARTLYRWLADDADFRAALTAAESATIDEAGRRLLTGQEKALSTLEMLIIQADKESDQRLAAVAWMDLALRWRELASIEERLMSLEALYVNPKK